MPYLIHSSFSLTGIFHTFSFLNTSPAPLPLPLLVIWLHVSLRKEKQSEKNFHKPQTISPCWCVYPAFSLVTLDELSRLLSYFSLEFKIFFHSRQLHLQVYQTFFHNQASNGVTPVTLSASWASIYSQSLVPILCQLSLFLILPLNYTYISALC